MDTTADGIGFTAEGVCSYCEEFVTRSGGLMNESAAGKEARLASLVREVKRQGEGKQYDCVVGVSGGVDSTWALVKAKELGLRPLAVHMDNGWNSELAQNNVANLVKGLNVDLYTHVIDWTEYRSLMQAFFDAGVIDVELLYDNAMLEVCYYQAHRYGLKSIITGCNQATEGIRMPPNWNWYKRDAKNIKSIARIFNAGRIKSFPLHSTAKFLFYQLVRGIQWIPFLDYFTYDKNTSIELLVRDHGFKSYPYKHYESIFTRFYQAYLLPQKFRVDKRRIHLSTLIVTGQISRERACQLLSESPYPAVTEKNSDLQYFLKKMNWSAAQLDNYCSRPGVSHNEYPNERAFYFALQQMLSPRVAKRIVSGANN
jgi:N-acetyl sugar amidotransferase